jgi:hypothetical protein
MKRISIVALLGCFLLIACGGSSSSPDIGPVPTISSIDLPRSGVMGGGTVTIDGSDFVSGAEVWFGVNASSSVSVISSTRIDAQIPAAGQPGTVDFRVDNPAGGSLTLAGGFEYLLVGTPTLDGAFTDWNSSYELVVNTGAGNGDLQSLSASFDSTNLYLAIVEETFTGYGVIAWLDVNVGSGDGVTTTTSLTDGNGVFDVLVSNVEATITHPDFEADAVLGSIDHTPVADTTVADAGARGFGTDGLAGTFSFLAPLRSTVSQGAGDENLEMAVPLASLFPAGIPTTGQTVGIFVTATFSTGDFATSSDQVLPAQSAVVNTNTRLIDDVVTFRIFPSGQY